ncbi:hypothetical protein ACFPRL_13555 [Pseudoclavibacter helvolus]
MSRRGSRGGERPVTLPDPPDKSPAREGCEILCARRHGRLARDERPLVIPEGGTSRVAERHMPTVLAGLVDHVVDEHKLLTHTIEEPLGCAWTRALLLEFQGRHRLRIGPTTPGSSDLREVRGEQQGRLGGVRPNRR